MWLNACKTLLRLESMRSATPHIAASRFELPLLGSNQDSPDPESGVLPVTPRGREKDVRHQTSDISLPQEIQPLEPGHRDYTGVY